MRRCVLKTRKNRQEQPLDAVITKTSMVKPGTLYIVGTPIGNLEDISLRALRVLKEVDLIAAEDTRTARILLDHYLISTPTISYFEGNESRRNPFLLEQLRQNKRVALISEAGLPGISDPGSHLIQLCLEHDLPVDVIPGPNAALTALILSGLPSQHFCYFGFLPRRGPSRKEIIKQLSHPAGTLILYESPRRVGETLAELYTILGNRRAAVVREMTKLYQEVIRGTLAELAEQFKIAPPRGEVTLVIAGNDHQQSIKDDQARLRQDVESRCQRGESPRDIAAALALFGKRQVYQLALEISRQLLSGEGDALDRKKETMNDDGE